VMGRTERVRPSSPYPWKRSLLVGASALVIYAVLPHLAPTSLTGDLPLLVLGILNGIAVAIGVRAGFRTAPAIGVGAAAGILLGFGVIAHVDLLVGVVAAVIALELVAFLAWLDRSNSWRLRDPQDLLRFAAGVAVISIVGGAVAALFAMQSVDIPLDDYWHGWRSWVIDDLFGLVCIAPAVITLRRPSRWSWSATLEWWVAVAYTAAATWFVFFHTKPGDPGLLGWPFFILPGLIWIAVRLGLAAVAPVSALAFWLALVGTVQGNGAFAAAAPGVLDRMLAAEVFCIVMGMVVLMLAVLRDIRLTSQEQLRRSSRLLREVVDGSAAVIFAKDYSGERGSPGSYVLVNTAGEKFAGRPAEEIIGRTDDELFPAPIADAFQTADRIVLEGGHPVEQRQEIPDDTGVTRVYQGSSVPLTDAAGKAWGIVGFATDVTDLIRAREHEARQAELLHAVFELSPTPAVRLSISEGQGVTVEAANAAMCHLLGAAVGEFAECDLIDHIHPDDTATALDVLGYATSSAHVPGAPLVRQRELRMRTLDARTVWVLMSAAAVRGLGQATEVVAQFEDITARRAAEEALSDQALRDAVTGLPNRRALHERMDSALQRLRRHPGSVAVLFCDLDHFKDVNDSLGHQVGDRLLVEVAERLRSAVRPEDTIARLGGDEFVRSAKGSPTSMTPSSWPCACRTSSALRGSSRSRCSGPR
jgi:PAS domain S-box-containing protein